jgi:hypothetical protein
MVRKHANSWTTSQNSVGIRRKPDNALPSICPGVDVTRRHGNSDTSDALEAEFGIEQIPDRTHRRITNMDCGTAAKARCYAVRAKTPDGCSELSVEQIPHRFPKTDRAHETQQDMCAGFEKPRQVAR